MQRQKIQSISNLDSQHKHWRNLAIAFCALISLSMFGEKAFAKMPVAKVGENVIKLEVAATEAEVERGLMYRTSMPEDQGMVFFLDEHNTGSGPTTFWMYHTLIPLDMMFIKDGKIHKLFQNVPPCRSENAQECPQYSAGTKIPIVIEVNGGYCARHHIKEGDAVNLEMP
jgi:uncharacterized membrane protein (UPF0127 family)